MNVPKKRQRKRKRPTQAVDLPSKAQRHSSSFVREEEHRFRQAEHTFLEFIATLEHEFRTPLAIIKGSTSMLFHEGQSLLSQDQREAIQMIQDAEARLEVLANRLIEFTQLEAGLLALTTTVVDLPSLVRQVLTSTQQRLPATLQEKFTFALFLRNQEGKPAQDLPLVPGDRQVLRKVLQHVLDNAIRFSPQGGSIEIVIGLSPLTPLPSTTRPPLPFSPGLELCVCDYGIGIPEEYLERIFERFYRIDTSLTREGHGLGLGLPLCRLLLGLQQGHIWAESCPAGGSAFHIWLPLEQVPSAA
jgi:signal transduction histidine kinase